MLHSDKPLYMLFFYNYNYHNHSEIASAPVISTWLWLVTLTDCFCPGDTVIATAGVIADGECSCIAEARSLYQIIELMGHTLPFSLSGMKGGVALMNLA